MEPMYYIGLDVHKEEDQLLREGQRWQGSLDENAASTDQPEPGPDQWWRTARLCARTWWGIPFRHIGPLIIISTSIPSPQTTPTLRHPRQT
jgi:hypothetical protein